MQFVSEKIKDKMKNYSITVILPSLNVVSYITHCVNSVISQSIFHDLEILLIDAGSTDGTLEILESYDKEYDNICLIRSDRKSYGYQVNTGIREARGKYIAILETDDYIREGMYETLYDLAETNSLDCCKGEYFRFETLKNGYEYGNVIHMLPEGDSRYGRVLDPTYEDDLYMNDYFIWKGIYNADFLRKNNIYFNETPGASFQDIGFAQKVLTYADRAMYIRDVFYCYRIDRKDSSMNSGKAIIYSRYEFERLLSDNKDEIYLRGVCLYMLTSFVGNFIYLTNKETFFQNEAIRNSFEWLKDRIDSCFRTGLISPDDVTEEVYRNYRRISENPIEVLENIEEGLSDNNTLTDRIREEKAKRIVIFGAGNYGKNCMIRLDRAGISVDCFLDNSPREDKLLGVPVVRPDTVDLSKDCFVVIANKNHYSEMKEQALTLGAKKDRIFIWK